MEHFYFWSDNALKKYPELVYLMPPSADDIDDYVVVIRNNKASAVVDLVTALEIALKNKVEIKDCAELLSCAII